MKAIGIDIGTTTISTVVAQTDNMEVLESKTIQNGCFIKTEQEWEWIQDAETLLSLREKLWWRSSMRNMK